MAFLHVDRGDLVGQMIPLNQDKIFLGRNPDCDVVISAKKAVSRYHAHILRVKDQYFIEDRESRNKTYVNDQELPPLQRTSLKHLDRIRICEFQATFYLNEGESTVEATLSSMGDPRLDQQPAAKLAALLEITARLSKTLELDVQLPEVVDGLLRLFPQADRCFLILVQELTGNLEPRVVRTREPNDQKAPQTFSFTIVRRCLETNQAILWREGDPSAASTESVVSSRLRSVMCIPLCPAEGPPFGVIQLDTQDAVKRFTEDDLRLLWGVSQQASIAMENTRYHELRLERERIKKEMELARQVQLNFLPKTLPEVPGYDFFAHYESAREVGGDYYDFIELPNQHLAITIGDVAGKGMPAALLMARLFSDCRSCFLTERKPTAAISTLNQKIYPLTSPMDRFVSLVTAVLDPATHTLTLVNAGHPIPLLYRHVDRAFSRALPLEYSGPLLGKDAECLYPSYQVALEPGDCLLLFSDGVTDAQNVAGRSFRLRGIHDVLAQVIPDRPAAFGQRIVQAVQAHAQDVEQYDDIALVCFGRCLPAELSHP